MAGSVVIGPGSASTVIAPTNGFVILMSLLAWKQTRLF
jgi:hypothetical protein